MADTKRWNFSHNNEPAVVLEVPAAVTNETEVVRLGLQKIGQPDSKHPCRAWPAKDQLQEQPSE